MQICSGHRAFDVLCQFLHLCNEVKHRFTNIRITSTFSPKLVISIQFDLCNCSLKYVVLYIFGIINMLGLVHNLVAV
jgi:hypothetical protein